MAYGDSVIVVTWLDGKQETYTCYDYRVSEGVLFLNQRMHSGQPGRAIPLAGLRIWTVEDG
jgi:hypothetical protein